MSPRLRLTRPPASERISLPPIAVRRRSSNPALVFVYGFAVVILAGAVALMLPFSNTQGEWTPFLDALFTATSAVCVTGLIVVDTGTYWSGIGQAIIAVLMQVGGFGFMTSSTVLLLLIGHRATLRERVLLREALGAGGLGSVLTLARRVGAFMLIAEGIGVVILTARFLTEMDAPRALWWGVFHTVSAFNNAGFDIVGGYRGLTPYSHDPVVLLTIAALFIAGGISYTVVEDLARHRSWVRLTLDTKLVLVCMTGLAVAGTLGLLLTERANSSTLGGMEPGPRVLNAFFQAVSRTAGFSSVDIGKMTEDGLFLLMPLMFIGGSAGSTAGGIKVQTFGLLFFAIVSAARGLHEVEAFRRRAPDGQMLRALAVALLSIALVFGTAFVLNISEGFAFHRVLFEAISALATVGYSTGITAETTVVGRAILIAAMFVGRLGPLTLVVALAARERRTTYHWPEEAVKLG